VAAGYYVVFHAWALGASYSRPSATLASWATVVSGGYLQASATYIGSSAFTWTDFAALEPRPVTPTFWLATCALAVMPVAYAARCWHQIRS
jgi:hypothetical protein